jgi:hypothetical protein
MNTPRAGLAAILGALVLAACEDRASSPTARPAPAEAPAKAPAGDQSPAAGPPSAPAAPAPSGPAADAERTVSVLGLSFVLPEGWKRVPPANQMRLAEAVVDDASGDPARACTVVFSTAGGDVPANIARWASQVQDGSGKPSTPTVTTRTAAGLSTTVAEMTGLYAGMGTAAPKPDWTVRGAVIETRQGLLFIKMTGPADAMATTGPGFSSLLDSARVP